MARPLVSVIIPTYNRFKYIQRAIKSVLNQTFQSFEIIVVDDASTDSTADYILSLQNIHQNIYYHYLPTNKGAQAARNFGIKESKGKWIAFLDSDDEWLPNRLMAGLNSYKKTGANVIHSECYIKNGNNVAQRKMEIPALSGNVYKDLLKYSGPMFQGLLVKRFCLEHIGFLDEPIVSYQEWDTSIRLAKCYPFAFVAEPLFIYNCHKDDTISKDMKRDADGYAQVVEKHKEEIRIVAGEDSLKRHYTIISNKYKALNQSVYSH